MNEDTKPIRDFVDYNPSKIKILTSEEFEVAAKYNIIISALRDNILTVKEIHDLYLSDDEDDKTHSVTQQTIYRYLEEMENSGLVIVAGYRKTEGIKASERIYGRTAKTFITIPDTEVTEIQDEDQKEFLRNLSQIIAYALDLDSHSVNEDDFIDFYQKYAAERSKSIKYLYEKAKDEEAITDLISRMPLHQVNEAMWYVQLFVPFIKNPEVLRELQMLFQK